MTDQATTARWVGGRYRLDRELGRGGMGAVWQAVDMQLGRRVAVKRMASESVGSPRSRRDFEREARGVARLASPHIVQVYDYGVDGDVPFLVMELLEGEDLEARLSRDRRLAPRVIASLLSQAAQGLDAAHAAGVVHRDLKPANVFLARGASGDVVKLLDFGVAAWRAAAEGGAVEEADVDPSGAGEYFAGTVAYLSPEQAWDHQPADPRSDLWSLAVVVYRALTGALPFPAHSLGELVVKIHGERPVPPSAIVPELGRAADAFFERALARDPADRFPSATAMATSFAELVETGALPARAKILVIDDEPDVFALLTQHFRDSARRGTHDLVYAADGREALDRLRDHPDIDVALADLNMPRLDGFGFLEAAPSINPALKTVVISAYGDMTNVRRAMNKGAFDFLVKPIDLDDLDVTVEKALRHARAVRRVVQSTEQVARAAPVESIRATIVFVGISGWIAASERLRPEEAVRALNAHFDVVAPEITGRGGLVDKILGPAMLVVFRGDQHAPRAVSACVAARRRLDEMAGAAGTGVAGRLSAGIDSGLVVACSLGSATLARLDETVLGRAVGAAARLHARARSGEILVTEAVHRAVEPFFVTQEIEARRDEKVERAFCIVQETTEPRAARLDVAHSTPFIS